MDILEENNWTHVFGCDECGSALRADEGDVRSAHFDTAQGVRLFPFVECPKCGEKRRLEWVNIPNNMHASLRESSEESE